MYVLNRILHPEVRFPHFCARRLKYVKEKYINISKEEASLHSQSISTVYLNAVFPVLSLDDVTGCCSLLNTVHSLPRQYRQYDVGLSQELESET